MEIYGFGLGVGAACLAGGVIGRTVARRRGVAPDEWWRLVTGLMISGLIGARLAYIVPHAGYYLLNPLDIVRPPIEGYSYYGALLFGWLYAARFARRIGRSLGFVVDLVALPWLVALVVTAVIWGAPVVKVGSPLWLVFLVDIVYLTVVYALLAWGWQKQRRVDGSGRLAAAVLSVDAALRLVAGLVLGVYLPVPLAEQTANHVTRAVAAALGAVFLLGTRRRPAWPAWEGPPAPFSRWAGWLLAYGALAVIRWAVFSATHF
ncbi:MAG TPA: prolipoprotein diacylglyceryl transferase family protein [Limnochordia bacterium]|nr:prolipoprotein diacylglyceryl transferase family protein [Limnochordia bacterium]